MAKKHKCRYTPEELEIHDKAVKLRKMTDRQLVEAFSAAQKPSPAVSCDTPTNYTNPVEKLIEGLSRGECRGIKGATVHKLSEYAAEMGLI